MKTQKIHMYRQWGEDPLTYTGGFPDRAAAKDEALSIFEGHGDDSAVMNFYIVNAQGKLDLYEVSHSLTAVAYHIEETEAFDANCEVTDTSTDGVIHE